MCLQSALWEDYLHFQYMAAVLSSSKNLDCCHPPFSNIYFSHLCLYLCVKQGWVYVHCGQAGAQERQKRESDPPSPPLPLQPSYHHASLPVTLNTNSLLTQVSSAPDPFPLWPHLSAHLSETFHLLVNRLFTAGHSVFSPFWSMLIAQYTVPICISPLAPWYQQKQMHNFLIVQCQNYVEQTTILTWACL